MRCSKCNKWLPLVTKFCSRCGTVVPPEQKKKSWLSFFISLGVAFLAAVTYSGYFYQTSGGATNHANSLSSFIPGLLMSTLLLFAAILLLVGFIKFLIRHPIFGVILLVIFIIGPLITFIFGANSVRKTTLAMSEIQSNLTDITLVKLTGNSIVAGKKMTGYSLESIKSTTETASQNITNLSTPSILQNYQQVAILWANKIAIATKNTKTWKNISNQPGDFPLILDNGQAETFFQSSIKSIAELKQAGSDAIKNKDKQAMRLIAAKLLVQKHWLDGILYSTNFVTTAFNLIPSVFAQGVPDIQGVDVTCQVCSDPKIKWTDQLRAQYGCDTRCKPQQTQTQNTKTEQQAQDKQNDTNNLSDEDIKKLESFTYKGKSKRAICIGTGGLSIGGSMTNVFCVEDAVTTITEIAFSAIGFADGTKILSVTQWEKEYEEIDNTFSKDGTISEPSYPSVEGGYLLEGMGTIGTSEPDKAPEPKKSPSNSNQPKLTTPPPVIPPVVVPPTPPNNSEDYWYPPAPEIPQIIILPGDGNGGSGPAPIIDLERDYSAEQTGGNRR